MLRLVEIALGLLLLAGAPVVAQPAIPAAPPPAPTALFKYVLRWEIAMRKVQTLQAQLTRIEKDPAFNKTQEYRGFAQYMKETKGDGTVLNLATLEMRPKANPHEVAEKFIFTGTHLFQFIPAQLEVKDYEIPKPKPGKVAQDNGLALMFGMNAADARTRYEMKLAKEDDNYIYIDIQPRSPKDKADFQLARIVLNKDTFLPRQIWLQQSGSEVTWDIPHVAVDGKVERADFEAPKLPRGWKLTPVPLE